MRSPHPEDLEFLRSIRGCFGSRRMFCVEYEFTGEQIIERHGGRKTNEIDISDIIEANVSFGQPNQMILKTDYTKMKIQIFPSLKEVIDQKWTDESSKMSEAERRHFEEVKRQMISRIKRINAIATVIFILVVFAVLCFVASRAHHSHG